MFSKGGLIFFCQPCFAIHMITVNIIGSFDQDSKYFFLSFPKFWGNSFFSGVNWREEVQWALVFSDPSKLRLGEEFLLWEAGQRDVVFHRMELVEYYTLVLYYKTKPFHIGTQQF